MQYQWFQIGNMFHMFYGKRCDCDIGKRGIRTWDLRINVPAFDQLSYLTLIMAISLIFQDLCLSHQNILKMGASQKSWNGDKREDNQNPDINVMWCLKHYVLRNTYIMGPN